jgi:glycosyltransferase involved in cell wall biosynthesis
MREAVSVLMPVRNAKSTLEKAVDSIQKQSFPDFSCIVIDDGSDDGGVDKVKNTITDDRFRFVSQPPQGVAAALNHGLSLAKGKYVARMDADDLCHPDRFARQVEFLEENTEIGVVSSRVNHKSTDHNSAFHAYVEWINEVTSPKQISNYRFIDSPIAHPSVMLRSELFEYYGPYNTGKFPEDYELWLRLLDHKVQFAKVDQYLLDWHDSPDRISRVHPNFVDEKYINLKAYYFAQWARKNNINQIHVWGKGDTLLKKIEPLDKYGIEVAGFIDMDKTSRTYQNKPVTYYKDIPKKTDFFALVFIPNRNVKKEVTDFLKQKGFEEGLNFLMIS